jgi:glutaminyl-peptide cyclotransferase
MDVERTPTDSLYGSRHLAERWATETIPTISNNKNIAPSSATTILQSIDLFVLLDLLGGKNPHFHHAFENSFESFKKLEAIEKRLAKFNLLQRSYKPSNPYFNPQLSNYRVDDDHKPFLDRGVPVVHLISIPFPDFWHKKDDDRAHLDHDTISDLRKILRIFIFEYLRI